MKESLNWKFVGTFVDGLGTLFGVDIFNYEWTDTGCNILINDPLYNREYSFAVFNVTIDEDIKIFAAGEFSNCIWGFYIPT